MHNDRDSSNRKKIIYIYVLETSNVTKIVTGSLLIYKSKCSTLGQLVTL
jgi:hypothetical protein